MVCHPKIFFISQNIFVPKNRLSSPRIGMLQQLWKWLEYQAGRLLEIWFSLMSTLLDILSLMCCHLCQQPMSLWCDDEWLWKTCRGIYLKLKRGSALDFTISSQCRNIIEIKFPIDQLSSSIRIQVQNQKSHKGKRIVENTIKIEIPTVKLQKNWGRIMSTDIDFETNQDH